MPKGGDYERTVCKLLSEWLTHGRSDDELWRSSQSGGRATTRAKKGKKTKGHSGDTVATGKHGRRLLKIVTMELKRGYNKTANVHSLLDLRHGADAVQMYESWFLQAHTAAARADTPYWWLIHRRDRREAMLFMPFRMWKKLNWNGEPPTPFVMIYVRVRAGKVRAKMKSRYMAAVGIQLAHFLFTTPPENLWRAFEAK